MNPKLAVVSLWTPDLPASSAFFRDILDLTPIPDHQPPHFDLAGVILVLLPGQPGPPQEPTPTHFPCLALRVESLDEALRRLQQAGIEPLFGVEENAAARFIRLHEPGGNLIELVEWQP